MSRHPQKTTVAAKFVYAKKANIGSLRAKSLTVADPLPTLNVSGKAAIGDKKGNGAFTVHNRNDPNSEKQIVILGEWHDNVVSSNATGNTVYDASNGVQVTLSRKGINYTAAGVDYHFDISKGLHVMGPLMLGGYSNTFPDKDLHTRGVIFYSSTTQKKTLSLNNGSLCIGGQPILTGTPGLSQAANSDDRLKHNETEINNATATLAKLKPYVYDMTETFLPADYKGPLDEKKTPYHKESGFIAQEIQQIPELEHLVVPGDETTPFRLKYDGFLAFLVEGFQEMSAEIKALKAKVQSLEAASASS